MLLALLLSFLAVSAEDPITDKLRYEIAAAQRDYLIAKSQMDPVAARLQERLVGAQKACEAHGTPEAPEVFDAQQMVCAPKPETTEQKRARAAAKVKEQAEACKAAGKWLNQDATGCIDKPAEKK